MEDLLFRKPSLSSPEPDLQVDEIEKIEKVLPRILAGEPLPYLTGLTWFDRLRLKVNSSVLIPRPETEELVLWMTEYYTSGSRSTPLKILDIGTGSGCIALALSSRLPGAEIYGVDISSPAIALAQENASELSLPVQFYRADLMDGLQALPILGQWDAIVSNPPYISRSERNEVDEMVVQYEPHQALFVEDDDPLIFYRHLSLYASGSLRTGGVLWLESGIHRSESLIQLLEDAGFTGIQLKKDLNGKDRMWMAVWAG